MPKADKPGDAVDWSLATWNGSRREALRRWAQLPLERVIAALEEMQELRDLLARSPSAPACHGAGGAESAVHEPRGDYNAKTGTPSAPGAGRGSRRVDK